MARPSAFVGKGLPTYEDLSRFALAEGANDFRQGKWINDRFPEMVARMTRARPPAAADWFLPPTTVTERFGERRNYPCSTRCRCSCRAIGFSYPRGSKLDSAADPDFGVTLMYRTLKPSAVGLTA